MSNYVKCEGKTFSDCYSCGMYSSSHSLHYDHSKGKKVSEVTCGIGGTKYFNEDGEEI